MATNDETTINCERFEELLSDYIDRTLGIEAQKACGEHALACPLCHELLNEVKSAVTVCHEMSEPAVALTRLEAKILQATAPEFTMSCAEFETHLTDYLDGFLPAKVFHKWERHAALCTGCTDLPGEVVRSIGVLYTYKNDELPVPEGLHRKIMESTIGTANAKEVRLSFIDSVIESLRGLSGGVLIPRLAPIAMMLLFAMFVFSQHTSADSSFGSVYSKSIELAEQTVYQTADIMRGTPAAEEPQHTSEPIKGTFTNGEDKK